MVCRLEDWPAPEECVVYSGFYLWLWPEFLDEFRCESVNPLEPGDFTELKDEMVVLTSSSRDCWVSHSFIVLETTLWKVIGMGGWGEPTPLKRDLEYLIALVSSCVLSDHLFLYLKLFMETFRILKTVWMSFYCVYEEHVDNIHTSIPLCQHTTNTRRLKD